MTAAVKISAAIALVLLALVTVGAWLLFYPLRLAAQAAGIGPRPKRRNSLAVAAISGLFGIAAGLVARPPRQPVMSEDDDYLAGVERGIRAARRAAGYEDGKLSETCALEGRPTP